MNFEFVEECKSENAALAQLYQLLYAKLSHAEKLYYNDPQRCGILLREAAECICRIYNIFYEVGFYEEASLEEFLCYTDKDQQNVLVSKFLSAVRKEERDRLNKLRILGDDCIWGEEAPDQGMTLEDRMEQNAKRMMETVMESLKHMCHRVNGRDDLEDRSFCETILPGYKEEETIPVQKSGLQRLLERIFDR